MDKDEFIRKEREADEKRLKEYMKDYEKAKKAEAKIPIGKRLGEKVKGSLSREKIRRAGGSVRGGILKAAKFEPSKQTKARINELGKYATSEAKEAGRSFGPSNITFGRQNRPSKKSRRSYSYPQDDEGGYSGGDISAYADSFSPPSLRFDPYGRPTGRIYETDQQQRQIAEDELDDTGFVNPYADYINNFDPFSASNTQARGGKRKQSSDIISRWFT